MPSTATAPSATLVTVMTVFAVRIAWSRPRFCSHSTKTGTKTEDRIPPRASS